MARRNSVEIELDLDGRQAQRELSKVAREARNLEGDLDGAESAGAALARSIEQKADGMIAEIDATRLAVDAMERALDGVDLDATKVVSDLKRLGLTAEEVEADAEALAKALQRSGDVRVHAARQGFQDVGDAVDSVRENSERARGATHGFLGGMVGDSAAAATGLGPLGEAVSQIAEGALDGEIGMKGLAKTGAGLAVMALTAWSLTEAFSVMRDRQERLRQRTEAWSDALAEARGEVQTISDIVNDQETWSDDLVADFETFKLTAADVADLIAGGTDAVDAFVQSWKDSASGPEELRSRLVPLRDIERALKMEIEARGQATEKASRWSKFAGDAAASAADGTEELAEATGNAADAANDFVDALEAEADALNETADALNEQIDARMSMADSAYALRDSQADFTKQLGEAREALAETEEGTAEYQAILDDTAEAAAKVADAQVRLAEDTAAAGGKTLTAAERTDLFNRSMLDSALTADGPMRRAILEHIAIVNDIPAAKVTEIEAALDGGNIATAKRLLDDASRTRTAAIRADADTAEANRKLDQVARTRDALIRVTTRNPNAGHQAYASGTKGAAPGVALVGENGPELVAMAGGERVFDAGATAAMSAPAGRVTIVNNFPAGTSPTAVARASRRYQRIQGDL